MFENVNYTYYSDTMGRAVIPDEDTFNRYVDENKLYFKKLYSTGIISEAEEGGIDKAICMMIEVQYADEMAALGNGETASQSESISGYSYSLSKTEELVQTENFKTTEKKKLYWIGLYCDIQRGII